MDSKTSISAIGLGDKALIMEHEQLKTNSWNHLKIHCLKGPFLEPMGSRLFRSFQVASICQAWVF